MTYICPNDNLSFLEQLVIFRTTCHF